MDKCEYGQKWSVHVRLILLRMVANRKRYFATFQKQHGKQSPSWRISFPQTHGNSRYSLISDIFRTYITVFMQYSVISCNFEILIWNCHCFMLSLLLLQLFVTTLNYTWYCWFMRFLNCRFYSSFSCYKAKLFVMDSKSVVVVVLCCCCCSFVFLVMLFFFIFLLLLIQWSEVQLLDLRSDLSHNISRFLFV